MIVFAVRISFIYYFR